MPDLESRIAEWRRQMVAGGITNPEVLDELESHLREDIEGRVQSGLSPQEAFDAAVAKIGDVRVLKSEFAASGAPKASIRLNSATRLNLVQFGCVLFALFILSMNAWTLFADDLKPIERSLGVGFLAVAIGGLYLSAFRFRQNLLPAIYTARVAAFMKFMSLLIALWPFIAIANAARIFPVHIGLAGELIFWNLCSAGAFTLGVFLFCRRYPDSFDALNTTPWSFTARQSFAIARAEASGLYHDFIGTEHLLLGLLKTESVVPGILQKLGVNDDDVRLEIRKLVSVGPEHEVSTEIPFTPRAREALQLATKEAKSRHQLAPGPEHIFLGLLREGSGVAALALKNLGVRLENAREIISNQL